MVGDFMTGGKTYIFIDIEAALIRGKQSIIEIGAVKCMTDGKRETFTTLVQPYKFKKLNQHIQKLTGITTEELLHASSFAHSIAQFQKWCGQNYILLTFGEFDRKVLEEEMARYKLDAAFLFPLVDYQQKYMIAHHLREQPSLQKLMAKYELIASTQHRALADAESLCEIFKATNGQHLIETQQTNDMLMVFTYSKQLETHYNFIVSAIYCKVYEHKIEIIERNTVQQSLAYTVEEKEQQTADGESYTRQITKIQPSKTLKKMLQKVSEQSTGKILLTYSGLKSLTKWMRLHNCTMPKTENMKWQALLEEEYLLEEVLTEIPNQLTYEQNVCHFLKKHEKAIIEEFGKRNLFPSEVGSSV